jgi:glycosyltransferase involved in cell wall biosynthesis
MIPPCPVSEEPVQLTALVESPSHVCCRYRLAAFRPALARAGHSLQLLSLPRRWWSRARLFHALRGGDVILQRTLLPRWQLALLRRSARTLIFDFDDAVFLRDSYAPKGLHHAGRLRHFATTVQASDAVIAGNEFLRDHAARRTAAARVHVIPTCVDPNRYPLAVHTREGSGVCLVWVGSSSTLKGLERAASLLDELGKQVPGLRLKVVCDRSLTLRQLPIVFRTWDEANEAGEIADADIGISWVPDDDWSRGKCGLKVLQYMAAGLPFVANPVGVHADLITPGEAGYLCSTPSQWVEAITQLAGDPALRQEMGRAGRRRVEAEYSVEAGAARWLDVLDRLRPPAARAG